jgi:hypothetical protein
MAYNLQQLASRAQASDLASLLADYGIGGGVKEVYIPEFLLSETPHAELDGVSYEWLHFRFNNGAEGINVGLILDMLKRQPNRLYVLSIIQRDIAAQASS